ncbi:unnamed protein product [Vitrella brassicaformis CCMP3155]|uniref:Uncharacterized protein n=2 Tax=Vitrella brassicaformis TaxID=1169539 RepID=A0A0G4G0B1_VITBC|nr:unnamed protein product [Vitrella brassicaformis CCMP3155]|eukprot:CEM20967.1 unnamed protein product [Vitrella brassicaformis CCMP3155]
MDVNQFVANARAVKDSLVLLLDQDPATIAAQLGSVAPLLCTLTSRLQQGGPSLTSTGAVDAPKSTTEVAAASGSADTEPQAPVDTGGPSYRLIHRSGNNPPVGQVPARLRLSRDELANVYGHLQPWELARHRRRLGTPLFHQSAANYTKLVIDCEDDTASCMWEKMPRPVAQRWGKRATNVREIRMRHPEWGQWCRGTWVAVVEGHSIGRAAIAAKERRDREGGEAASAAAMRDDDGCQLDEGTLEKLSFEAVKLSIRIPHPAPSSALPPAPTAPIHLPALRTVENILTACLAARVGRQWRTPAVKTLTPRGWNAAPGEDCWTAWLGDCEAMEVLDLAFLAGTPANVLRVLPVGSSLAALRTLRGVRVGVNASPAEIDMLREVLVARGIRRSIRELKINLGPALQNTDDHWERLQKTAHFVDAVVHPQGLSQRIVRDCGGAGRISAELLSRSSSAGTPTAQRIVDEFAKTAGVVGYSGGDATHPVAITDDTFPLAHTLSLSVGAPISDQKKERALQIASHIPDLSSIHATREVPAGEVWGFLERLQTALVSREQQKSLSVEMFLPTNAFTAPLADGGSPSLWGRDSNKKLPPIKEVSVNIVGEVDDGELETFYGRVMAAVASFSNELKGHERTKVYLYDTDALHGTFPGNTMCRDFERRFLAEQAGPNFGGGPYKLSFVDSNASIPYLLVERRT